MKNKNPFLIIAIITVLVSVSGFAILATRMQVSNSSSISNTVSASSITSLINYSVKLSDSIPLPNVNQRFDHMSIDAQDQLVFIAARGNNSVFVVNFITKNASHFITGLNEPQGVFYVPQNNRLFVSNAGDGTVDVFDIRNYSLIKTLSFSSNADNMRFDQKTGLLYVGFGEGSQSGIGIINTSSDHVIGTIPLDGHPEAFELEQNGTKIYANVPTSSAIEVLDRVSRKVITTWNLTNALANYPMSLDEQDHRLFVGFRYPSVLVAYDTGTGKIVASVNSSKDADDMFYDQRSRLILVSCGEGFLDVFKEQNGDSISLQNFIPTGPLGRTSLFISDKQELLVAVPQQNGQPVHLLIFSIRP